MANTCCFLRGTLALSLLFVGMINFTCMASSKQETDAKKQQQKLIDELSIMQGKGLFYQKKHFKFLSQPISSQGSFIVSQASALWQTESPVFSQLLVNPDAIYQRLSLQESYQPLLENAELSAVLTTIFKGQINPLDWHLLDPKSSQSDAEGATKCLFLQPKSQQLIQIFKQVSLCIINNNERQIFLLDSQNNKTEILMSVSSQDLSDDNLNSLKPE